MEQRAHDVLDSDPVGYLAQAWAATANVVVAAAEAAMQDGIGGEDFFLPKFREFDQQVHILLVGHTDETIRKAFLGTQFDDEEWEQWKAVCDQNAGEQMRQVYREQIFNALDIFKDYYLKAFLDTPLGERPRYESSVFKTWFEAFMIDRVTGPVAEAGRRGLGGTNTLLHLRDYQEKLELALKDLDLTKLQLLSSLNSQTELTAIFKESVRRSKPMREVYEGKVLPALTGLWNLFNSAKRISDVLEHAPVVVDGPVKLV